METKTEEQEGHEQAASEQTESPFAILFELEGVAASGRQAAFDVLRSILGENKAELTPAFFSRYCLDGDPESYLPDLLDALGVKISADKLAEDVVSGVTMHLSSGSPGLRSGMAALLDEAKARDIPAVAVTSLAEGSAENAMKKLGLDKRGVQLFAFGEQGDSSFPRADLWMKVARSLNRSARRCAVFVSSSASCRAALAIGMECVVVPDEFTAFQDFGGASMVLDSLADVSAVELLDTLCTDDA